MNNHTCILILTALLPAACHKRVPAPTPQNTVSGTVATVGVAPYDLVSPFLCRITVSDLTCIATVDVRFRRGQLETQIARGHQFSFHTPKGQGKGTVWFGCADANECGAGYFLFGGNAQLSVVPVEPARYWNNAPPGLVPHGSLGIAEVDVNNDQFTRISNRWSGSIAPPLIKSGAGITVTCTDQACTVSLK